MKKRIRQKIEKSKRKTKRRLKRAVRPGGPKPTLRARNIHYEISEKYGGIPVGGIGAIQKLVQGSGLVERINDRGKVLKLHAPYHESDHLLNIAYNVVCGGKGLEDIEWRRNNEHDPDALGTESIPDPTTAGDFCRRFSPGDVAALQEAINRTRVEVRKKQDESFFERTAGIDADGTRVSTDGECKEGMDISYNGIWGYHPQARVSGRGSSQEPYGRARG